MLSQILFFISQAFISILLYILELVLLSMIFNNRVSVGCSLVLFLFLQKKHVQYS